MIEEQIFEVWKYEQEILDVIHQVCKKHDLKYSLAYGTLIGAVRHGGFIPWDDDIDLIMPRQDYEKLREIWQQEAPENYILQDSRINPDFTQNFLKIRKDHTTFLQSEEERTRLYHKGIFVDIFPGDRVAPGKLSRMLQFAACAVNLLYTRGFTSKSGGIIEMIERILLYVPCKYYPRIREAMNKFIQSWNGNETYQYVFPSTIVASRRYYPADIFENMTEIEFCGRQYSCVKDIDTVLRTDYGDYMQLPPESERVWKHHPIIIDFEHNYEELTQK